jgi:hypothetical protein
MKNIHLLPTDKPSRLYLTTHEYIFEEGYSLSTDECENKHIYITSDEEIKKGDWYYLPRTNSVYKCIEATELNLERSYGVAKIILTTDPELIKTGVQAIDDEFLEWFVKNSSCEKVEVNKSYSGIYYIKYPYKIIIPQEEPKQDWYCPKCQSYVSSESVTFEETHQICNTSVVIKEPKQSTKDRILSETPELVKQKVRETANKLVEPKQETLEEVALKLYPIILEYDDWDKNKQYRDEWINGAKWQQENIPICIYAENIYCHIENGVVIVEKNDKSVISYSEEDMRKAIQETITLMRYKATEFREHENTIIGRFKKK